MSENREDDAQEGGARIEDLPASDSDLGGEAQENAAYTPPKPIGARDTDTDPDEGGELRSDPDEGGEVRSDPDEGGEVRSPTPSDPTDS